MSAEDNADIARKIYELFNDLDFNPELEHGAEVELYAEVLSFRDRQGFREMMAHYMAPWPDGMVEVIWQLAGEDGATNECDYRATHSALLPMPDGSEVPPTGKKIELRFCEVWRMEDGKLKSLHNFADNLALMQQLGAIPEPVGAEA